MNEKHLLQAITELNKPQPKNLKFDMRWWLREERYNKKSDCGCIVGLLMTKPYFKKLGLKVLSKKIVWVDYKSDDDGKAQPGKHREHDISYKGKYGIYAMRDLFDLDINQSLYIFMNLRGTKAEGIKRIKQVLKGKKFTPVDIKPLPMEADEKAHV